MRPPARGGQQIHYDDLVKRRDIDRRIETEVNSQAVSHKQYRAEVGDAFDGWFDQWFEETHPIPASNTGGTYLRRRGIQRDMLKREIAAKYKIPESEDEQWRNDAIEFWTWALIDVLTGIGITRFKALATGSRRVGTVLDKADDVLSEAKTVLRETAESTVDDVASVVDDVPVPGRVAPARVPTGEIHHPISTKVGRELNQHPTLRGHYQPRDPRFTTQAIDDAAHRGYQTWHRQLDREVVQWLKDTPAATPQQFESWLRWRYRQPDLLERFPNGF